MMCLSSQTSCLCLVHLPCTLCSSGDALRIPPINPVSSSDCSNTTCWQSNEIDVWNVPSHVLVYIIAEYGQIDWWFSWRKSSCLPLEYDDADASADSRKSIPGLVRRALGSSALGDFGLTLVSSNWIGIESERHENTSRMATFPLIEPDLKPEKEWTSPTLAIWRISQVFSRISAMSLLLSISQDQNLGSGILVRYQSLCGLRGTPARTKVLPDPQDGCRPDSS